MILIHVILYTEKYLILFCPFRPSCQWAKLRPTKNSCLKLSFNKTRRRRAKITLIQYCLFGFFLICVTKSAKNGAKCNFFICISHFCKLNSFINIKQTIQCIIFAYCIFFDVELVTKKSENELIGNKIRYTVCWKHLNKLKVKIFLMINFLKPEPSDRVLDMLLVIHIAAFSHI